jgi:glycosyltransferase involved in cell wall biosynthesis
MAFSVVIICRDEEDHIGRCLVSLQGLTDDIVVVDTGSSDRTVDIVNTHPVTLIQRQWMGYGATKNYANLQAKYDWILSIDADEAVDEELYDSLREWQPGSAKLYTIRRINHIGDRSIRYGHLKPELKRRLFNKNIYQWDHRPVHELLTPEVAKGDITALKGNLLHYQAKDIEALRQQYEHYALMAPPKKGIVKSLAPYYHFLRSYVFMLGFIEGTLGLKLAQSIYMYAKLKN